MIKAILVFNNHGRPRLSKFYQYFVSIQYVAPQNFLKKKWLYIFFTQNEDIQQQIIKETFQLVSKRDDNVCNFLEGGSLIGGSDYKLIYRHYATLYFVFCVDSSESELGILDLIQVFVETLDKCFENVCELDLIFHADAVHYILSELVMGKTLECFHSYFVICNLYNDNTYFTSLESEPFSLNTIRWDVLYYVCVSRWNGFANKYVRYSCTDWWSE